MKTGTRVLKLPFLTLVFCLMIASGCQKPSPEEAPDSPSQQENSTESETEIEKSEPSTTSTKEEKNSEPEELTFIHKLSEEQIDAGYLSLFDNETLFGWRAQNDVNWSVADEAIQADSGPIGLLLTKVPFANFELSLDFRLAPEGNSGVFIRCAEDPQTPGEDCYEINLADGHPEGYQTGSIVGLSKYDSGQKFSDNEWHTLKITANGQTIEVTVDGEHTNTLTDERENWLKQGFIGLQKNSGAVAFRNIHLLPLERESLFTGEDLSGWREVPGSQSVFDVVNGQIHVVNGPGFLETVETFDDFLLQFQAKTTADDLNSGLFFRAMEGTEEAPSNGYEVQIHNGYQEGNRNQPANAGTGAIFRRVDARRVVSSDQEWCTITLVAIGPRIATWVNGYPVVNWKDEREPDLNPRKGKRLEAGHLSLQGHDPTTDLYFRKFLISEYPKD